ncbi:MAG: hypothetical protein IJ605_05360 [Prevotella sp.]|nr:hypothetical protein [Prevotella sp.]
MKKYIENLFLVLFALVVLAACKDEEGTEVGNDSQPRVTLYKYDAQPPYNGDNDVVLRVAANSKVQEAYYFVEKTESKDARGISADEYANLVVSNGQKIEGINGVSDVDLTITGMQGETTITVVAVNGGTKNSSFVTFKGLDWQDIADGTYYFSVANIKNMMGESVPTTLQYCANEEGLYRLKDVFGEGYSLKFTDTGETDSDSYGRFKIVRVAAQNTPLTFGNYGAVGVRDVATWQNNDGYLDNGMYADNSCFFWVQYFVSSGSLGYGYDEFVPND